MIKLVFCLHRQTHLSRAEFQDYWLHRHGDIVRQRAKAIGALRYVQSHTNHDDLQELLNAGRGGPEPYDGIAELWFADRASLAASFGTDDAARAGAELLADERKFIDLKRSPIWLCDEHVIIP